MKKLHLLALLAAMLFAPINLRAQKDVPITFEAMEAGAEVSFKLIDLVSGVQYSTDGSTWNAYTSETPITLASIGDKVSFRGTNTEYGMSSDHGEFSHFSCTEDCYIYGNVMSLINATGYASETTLTGEYAFRRLFYNNTHIKNHATKTIELPATTLVKNCYTSMFEGCTGLTAAPELPATTLAVTCYSIMFKGCTGLTAAPELPATTLADHCYEEMFQGCTSLVTAPELPATTLASSCYKWMFQGCTSLIAAPELPATTLASSCYREMFRGCTGLTTAPEVLPATTLADYCYYSMFYGCTSLTAAPELPATTLADHCYYDMFHLCSALNYVKCDATDISATDCTIRWLGSVAETGTFVTPDESIWSRDSHGIPVGWNVIVPFTDFAIDFRTDPYTVVGGGSLPTGVSVEGSMNTGDAAHGYRLPVISIPVTAGNYKVTMGTCMYSHQDGTVKTEDGSYTYATLETNTGVCYHQNTATNVVVAIFNVPSDQTIKVYGAEYTPYFAIEEMAAVPAFSDFEINFQSDPYNVISGAKPAGTVIAGSYNDNQHGYHNVEATVPVEAGTYRLTLGACGYGNGAGNVMSETNVELALFNQKLEENNKCYHQNTAENIVSVTFTVDIDQTVTIDCGEYTPYMKLEKISAYHVVFALSDAEGTAPAAVDVTIGDALTMPVNKTMYKDGYTLTGWSDGVNTYAIGDAFTPTSDAVLTPVFTANAVAITAATEPVTVRWYFGELNGAPSMHLEGNSGFLIAQATIGGNPIDVRLDIDATAGKFLNRDRGDKWAQINNGTVFSFPSKEGAVVNVETYSGNTTYDLADGTLTCNTNDYYSYLEVVYPAPAPITLDIEAYEDPEHTGDFYCTFFDSSNKYALPDDGTKAYAAELKGADLWLHEIASGDEVIPANVAVIFKSPTNSITLTQTDADAVTVSDQNCLLGTDEAMDAPANCYVISGHSSDNSVTGVGFYQYTSTLKAHKAYTIYNGSAAAPKRMRFIFDVATGIDNASAKFGGSEKILENGVLYIIKNGVRYNAQGQMVK